MCVEGARRRRRGEGSIDLICHQPIVIYILIRQKWKRSPNEAAAAAPMIHQTVLRVSERNKKEMQESSEVDQQLVLL